MFHDMCLLTTPAADSVASGRSAARAESRKAQTVQMLPAGGGSNGGL